MARSGLSLIALFALACAPADTLPLDEPGLDEELDAPADDPADDPVDDTGAPVDPLNLSFEQPPLADGETAPPAAWETEERDDAGAFAFGDSAGADHGRQYLVLQVDGSGATWVTSPQLAVLEEGVPTLLTFAMRSDCPTGLLTLLVDGRSDSFALLPTPSSWVDISFSIAPDAAQHGGALTAEIMAESPAPCALEIDHVRVQ